MRPACTLLLIESDANLRSVLMKMLVGGGYAVIPVDDWQSGLSRANEQIDIVVLGFHSDMSRTGKLSNKEAVAKISQLRAKRPVPVIVLTSTEECRNLSNRSLAVGIRAVPRLEVLEEVRRIRNRSFLAAGGAGGEVMRPIRSPPRIIAPLARQPQARPSSTWAGTRSPQRTVPPSTNAAYSHGLDGLLAEKPLSPGTIIDKYRIDAYVGEGGFAHVYRATHLVMSMPCALKVLKPSLAERQPQVVDGFCCEARNAINISHPNIVRVHDVTRGGPYTYLVMEWIEGLSLADVLRASVSLPANDALRIGIGVCAGLEAASAIGTIHRDVKPGNILLANKGVVKLVDFGLAMNLRTGDATAESASSMVVGTPAYMSPEQAFAPEYVDSRSDMYSLGATLFHICAGCPPYQGDDTLQLLLRHREHPIPNLCHFSDDCPPEFAGLVTRMLAKRMEDRFASLVALRTHMQELLDGMVDDGTSQSNGWSNVYLRKNRLSQPNR